MRLPCWMRRGHDWWTSKIVGEVADPWADVPWYVYQRRGLIVSAPPCTHCGAPNPEAYGERDGIYFHKA